MKPITQQAHELLTTLVRGHLAIDATAGNGQDTEFLARLVGPTGTVWAFDIQREALLRTASRLREREVTVELRLQSTTEAGPEVLRSPSAAGGPRIVCLEASHAEMSGHLPASCRGQIAAIMFNLGYLPGSDKSCITTTASTRAALDAAVEWLAPGGVLSVVVYPGHAGGREEAAAVHEWLTRRVSDGSWELRSEVSLPVHAGPQLFVLQRVA
jgi:predicted methyltransferase